MIAELLEQPKLEKLARTHRHYQEQELETTDLHLMEAAIMGNA